MKKRRKKKTTWGVYKHFIGMGVSLALIFTVISLFPVHDSLIELGLAGPLGAFVAGTLFASSFTIVIGTFFIGALAGAMPLWQLVLLGGIGTTMVDVTLFSLLRRTVFTEVQPLLRSWRKTHFMKILHSKYVSWTIPIIGAIIIMSPLPDELGVSMMGISSLDTRKFAALSLVLNCMGVFLVAIAARALE